MKRKMVSSARNGATGPFGEGGGRAEEVEVEEPEFLAGLVPGVPAEHADAEGCGELHVGGGATGETEDGKRRDRDEGGVEVTSGPKAPHVQEDEEDEEGCAGGGRQAADQSETPNSRKKLMARQ